ncbi:hypothetical protein ACT6QG_07460 [Xanthobacter sp. TB0136]|uniref:hypothetical protein n=1 Tax=Xanthobacter sp. TB0136 TaxID=3459177 RepID=UPI00403981A3
MSHEFRLHDISDFPLVRFDATAMYEGYGAVWCTEMEALIARDAPFVLVYRATEDEETHEDRKTRGIWMKANKNALAEKCRAFIIIEPDAGRRAEMEAMFPNLVRAFGTPQAARATREEAETLGRHVLAGGSLNDAA